MSEYTVHRSLLRMVRVTMLTPVHRQKCQQWAREHQNWTTEQWKKVAWSDESRFLLHHVDGRVRVRRLPGEHMAPGCTMGRRQAGGGSVMLWAMFCWETLGPAIHVDVTLTRYFCTRCYFLKGGPTQYHNVMPDRCIYIYAK